MIALANRLIETDDIATHWEAYYVANGGPTRATWRFIRRMSEELDVEVYVFVDCDSYGICNIYRTLKVGFGNVAHINDAFCVPKARYLGANPIRYRDL